MEFWSFRRFMGAKHKPAERLQAARSGWTIREKGSVASILRSAIESSEFSVQRLARRVGVDANTIYGYMKGRSVPETYVLRGFRRELGLSIDYLFDGGGAGASRENFVSVTVRGNLASGRYSLPQDLAYLDKDSNEKRVVVEFSLNFLSGISREWTLFGVRVSGSGMAARFKQGDLLIFREVDKWPDVGNKGLVLVRTPEGVFLKRFRMGLRILEGFRARIEPVSINNRVKPVGVAVGLLRGF